MLLTVCLVSAFIHFITPSNNFVITIILQITETKQDALIIKYLCHCNLTVYDEV